MIADRDHALWKPVSLSTRCLCNEIGGTHIIVSYNENNKKPSGYLAGPLRRLSRSSFLLIVPRSGLVRPCQDHRWVVDRSPQLSLVRGAAASQEPTTGGKTQRDYNPPEVRRGKYWGLGVFLLQYSPLVNI